MSGKIPHYKPKKLVGYNLNLNYNKFGVELSNAQYILGHLQGSQKKLQNSSLLISPLTAKEAAVSSKIEGTQSTVSDLFIYEAGGQPKHADAMQLSNYRNAISYAMKALKRGQGLTPHLVKTLHGILLKDVRHKGEIGEFRKDSVWIAEKASDPIEKAIYIPPEHYLVPEYIEDLFKYINTVEENSLIKAGISHYQFEAIHPFNDGNGRIGRLLIPLILCCRGELTQPILYISGYLDNHRDEYIEALHEVDKTGNYDNWLAFYFKSVSEQLKDTQKLIDKIYDIYEEIKTKFRLSKSPYLIPFLDFIFKTPVFTISMVKNDIKATRITITNLMRIFQAEKIIKEMGLRRGHSKIYIFNNLIDIL